LLVIVAVSSASRHGDIASKYGDIVAVEKYGDPAKSIAQNVQLLPQLSTLNKIITDPRYASVWQMLSQPNGMSLLAPDDNAFAAANLDVNDVSYVTHVIHYQTLNRTIAGKDFTVSPQFPHSRMNNDTYVNLAKMGQVVDAYLTTATPPTVKINFGLSDSVPHTADITYGEVTCSNGVLYVVNKVFVPFPQVMSVSEKHWGLDLSIAAVLKANLTWSVDNLATITFLAPTNQAWEAIGGTDRFNAAQMRAVISYHMGLVTTFTHVLDQENGNTWPTLYGEGLQIRIENGKYTFIGATNNCTIIKLNGIVKNGALHGVDTVLMPPGVQF